MISAHELGLAFGLCASGLGVANLTDAPQAATVRTIGWEDTTPLHPFLEARGLTAARFPVYVARLREANARRVHEGDLDHLIFYMLQSMRFTDLPLVEPALSAKGLVDGLGDAARAEFLKAPQTARARIPEAVRARAAALVRAVDGPDRDVRLDYFRQLIREAVPEAPRRIERLQDEYLRVMRFVYEKEFVAQRSGRPAAVSELYRDRGLSTDTSVEAGYLVYLGLGMVRSLEPRPLRRVLVVGPGLDLAPRTGLADARPPASYQPWTVIDAVLGLGLAEAGSLEVVAADINPRVIDHLRRARAQPPALTLISEVAGMDGVALSADYREYFAQLGLALGEVTPVSAPGATGKTVQVRAAAASALRAERLDIVTERLDGLFDVVVATNILPYFDDAQLMLAMSNIAAMLAPGGVFLHNEGRPVLGEITDALGLPFEASRHAVIATVRGAAAPLGDSIWVHRKRVQGASVAVPGP